MMCSAGLGSKALQHAADECCMWTCVAAAVYIVTLSLCLQQVRTGDLGGYATNDEFTRAVIANLGV